INSCGSPVGAALPEVLKASAEFRAAQGDDGVCAIDGPMHARPFEPSPDHHFASSLEDAGGGTQTLGVELRVAHASAIVEHVHGALGRSDPMPLPPPRRPSARLWNMYMAHLVASAEEAAWGRSA